MDQQMAKVQKKQLWDAIRKKCVDCCGGITLEVRHCPAHTCPLWPYRLGRADRTESILGRDLAEYSAKNDPRSKNVTRD